MDNSSVFGATGLMNPLFSHWERYGDPQVIELPLMNNPILFFGILAGFVYTTKVIGPKYAKSLAAYDFKPWMMTFDGFLFGLCGIGFCLGMPLTNMGADSFDCDAINPKAYDSIKTISIKYIAFMYTLIKLMEFMRPVMASLRGKDNFITSYEHLAYLAGQATVGYLAACFYPGGIFALTPLTDDFVSIISWGYIVLTIPADGAFTPRPFYRKLVLALRFLSSLSLFLQTGYFLLQPSCGLQSLKLVMTGYNLIVVLAMVRQYVNSGKSTKQS